MVQARSLKGSARQQQQETTMSEDFKDIKDEEKEKLTSEEHEQVIQEAANGYHSQRNKGWVAGLIIIGLGLVFLVSNLTGFVLNNWWALFILIPGIMSFVNAWNVYREDGRWSKRARGGLIGGLIITLVAVIFLFDLDWGNVWPLFLILGGLAVLLGGWFDR
jgi:hypothetical protein